LPAIWYLAQPDPSLTDNRRPVAVKKLFSGMPPRTALIRFLAAIIALAGLWAAQSPSARAAELEPLEIVTRSGVHVFSVELAKTEEQRRTGLMYRKSLPEGRGMLFDFSPAQNVSMWMKNTFISLDMIFIGSDGRILRIAENTVPQSEKIIPSGGPAKAVLEVIAGTARKYGIKPGDRVAHPLFGTR
jgi:uncharacterized membrane protein (UPF0127 family)